uniref:Uncharacterized protein n=1 Tax=Chaetoceros debilis TaxID=122233 RepID=A0A7S3Q0C3_9STRA
MNNFQQGKSNAIRILTKSENIPKELCCSGLSKDYSKSCGQSTYHFDDEDSFLSEEGYTDEQFIPTKSYAHIPNNSPETAPTVDSSVFEDEESLFSYDDSTIEEISFGEIEVIEPNPDLINYGIGAGENLTMSNISHGSIAQDILLADALRVFQDIHYATDEELEQAFIDIIEADVFDESVIEAVYAISGRRIASDEELIEVLIDMIAAKKKEPLNTISKDEQKHTDTPISIPTQEPLHREQEALRTVAGIKEAAESDLRSSFIAMIEADLLDKSLLEAVQTVACIYKSDTEDVTTEFLADIFLEIALARDLDKKFLGEESTYSSTSLSTSSWSKHRNSIEGNNVFERLYDVSENQRVDGRERRSSIEETLKKKHELPTFERLPLSRAADVYNRSIDRMTRQRNCSLNVSLQPTKEIVSSKNKSREAIFNCVNSMFGYLPSIPESRQVYFD